MKLVVIRLPSKEVKKQPDIHGRAAETHPLSVAYEVS